MAWSVLDVFLTKIVEQIATIKLAGGGYAFLLDKSGQILAHPDQTKVMKFSKELTSDLASLKKLAEMAKRGDPWQTRSMAKHISYYFKNFWLGNIPWARDR